MPYLLLILGLLIGLYALYRFLLNANIAQIKAFFLLAIAVVLCTALLTLALTGRLPAAIAIMAASAPLAAGWLKARNREKAEGSKDTEIATRAQALEVLGLGESASDDDIQAAYKRLMQKIHPDHEGSEWMAAKLNQARDILTKNKG